MSGIHELALGPAKPVPGEPQMRAPNMGFLDSGSQGSPPENLRFSGSPNVRNDKFGLIEDTP